MSSAPRRISKQDVESIYPLVAMQKGMLFHELYSPEAQPYFRQVSFGIEGEFDVPACERAWNELMARHEVTRSCFDYENTSQLLQLVWKKRSVDFAYDDLANLGEDAQAAALDSYREQDRKRGFDLRRDPLMRIRLVRLGERRFEMIWSHPHIILDGWSGSVLLTEFDQIYSDLRRNRAPSLPPAPPYREYLDWLAARDLAAARSYWADLLAGYESLATLPRKEGAPKDSSYQPEEHAFALSGTETTNLHKLAARNAVTLSTVIQCLWSVLLGRYNDREDVIFGSVVSGRPAEVPGIESMVGLFINTIPMRVRMDSASTFAALMQNVQREAQDSMQYDFVPLAEIQSLSALKQRLLDHIVVFENFPEADPLRKAEFVVTSAKAFERANYDFGVLVLPGTRLRITFKYDANAYTAAQMLRLEGHFRTLLGQILQNDRSPLGDLEILTPAEKTVLVGPQAAYPEGTTIISLWEAQVERTPDSPAVVFEDRQWSYREINERVNGVAHFLRTRLAQEDRVGMLMDRGEGRIVALLGILKAGCAYLPISTSCPEERLRFLIEDSGCRAVLTDSVGMLRVNLLDPGLAVDIADCCAGPDHNPPHVCKPRNLAYVIYTSGSTGQPKGVLIEHGGFVNMILDQIRGFGITPSDRVLQFASSSFDASLSETFMALLTGACLVLIGEEARRDGGRFLECMRQQRISVVTFPPSYLRALEQPEFPDLRVLISAGEPPDLQDARHYCARLRYFNAYGPTETSVCTSFCAVQPGDADGAGISIGRPVANCKVRLLDRRLRPVPAGVPGEICVSGPGLARGYLNNPELTDVKFVASPFEGETQLYRTGDSGCWREDGEIAYQGRTDTQVKLRGYRIELGEIESRMREVPGIQQAAAVIRGEQLVCYFVGGSADDVEFVRRHLARMLPPHMVPSVLVPLAAISLTTAGKVDRAALPAPEGVHGPNDSADHTPRNEVERIIAEVWQEVLGRNAIGISDSFFALGGDSLKAILAAGRLRRRGLNLELRDLFRLETIAAVAGVVTECRTASAEVTGVVPLTPIQRWFFDGHSRGSWHHLNHAVLLRTVATLPEAQLRAAVDAIWKHHDALRMRYRMEKGVVVQDIAPPASCPGFEVLDLRAEKRHWELVAAHADALHERFDLQNGPLLKAVWCRLDEGEFLLLIAHHLVVDAVSWRILLDDLSDSFQQALAGCPISLPAKTSSYADWSRALAAYARSDSLRRQQPYWSEVESAVQAPIPTDFPALAHHYRETDLVFAEVPAMLGRSVPETEIQTILLAALARTLRRWTGCDARRVLLASHGRALLDTDVDVSRTVGWFTANFPFLLSTVGVTSISAELVRIRRALAEVPAQGVGYGVLKYLTPAEMRAGIVFADAPEIALNYLGRIEGNAAGVFSHCDRLPSSSAGTLERSQKLEFDAMLTEARLSISVRYCPKLHRKSTVTQIRDWLQEELLAVLDSVADRTKDRS